MRNTPPVVAFTGPIGSGKSTAAAYLVREHGYTLVKFAAPLKAMMRCLGLTDDHIEGDLKEKPCRMLGGRTPRYAMQTLGTEWGRDLIDPALWVNAWRDLASDVLDQGGRVVVDDLRFPNEASMVRIFGGIVVQLDRPNVGRTAHASENGAFHVSCFIANDGSPADLEQKLAALWR